jgi:hypothetical protein
VLILAGMYTDFNLRDVADDNDVDFHTRSEVNYFSATGQYSFTAHIELSSFLSKVVRHDQIGYITIRLNNRTDQPATAIGQYSTYFPSPTTLFFLKFFSRNIRVFQVLITGSVDTNIQLAETALSCAQSL